MTFRLKAEILKNSLCWHDISYWHDVSSNLISLYQTSCYEENVVLQNKK